MINNQITTQLHGRLAFITGGSSGIGLATAVALANQGDRIVLFARDRAHLDAAVEEIGVRVKVDACSIETMSMDVSENPDVQLKMKAAVSRFGTPDILINSAGIPAGIRFENTTYEDFDEVMKTNVYGPRNTVAALLPYFKERKQGHIVNIGSLAGLIGMFGYSLYSATKYALVGFSESLRSELKPYGIRVSLVCPPEVKTPLIDKEAKSLPPESRAVKNLAGVLTPEQVADDIVRTIKKNRFLSVPGGLAKLLYLTHRLSGGHLTRLSSDWVVGSVSRRLKK